MAIDFPNSPSVDDQFTSGGTTWIWDGTSWNLYLGGNTVTQSSLTSTLASYALNTSPTIGGTATFTNKPVIPGYQDTIPYQSSAPSATESGTLWINSNNDEIFIFDGTSWSSQEKTMTVALSDEETAITTGTGKLTMRAPFAMTLTQIPRASLNTASTSGFVTVDINEGGTSVLGANKLSIDANEKTSVTAITPTTIADTSIADDAEITFDIDAAGTGAKGLKVTLYFKRT